MTSNKDHSTKHTPFGPLPSNIDPFRFTGDQPCGPADAPPNPPSQRFGRDSFSAHILIVVSDPIECARLGRAVCQCGHSVSLACDPREAAALLAATPFNLVIVEIPSTAQPITVPIERLLRIAPCRVALLTTQPEAVRAMCVGREPAPFILTMTNEVSSLEEQLRRIFLQ